MASTTVVPGYHSADIYDYVTRRKKPEAGLWMFRHPYVGACECYTKMDSTCNTISISDDLGKQGQGKTFNG